MQVRSSCCRAGSTGDQLVAAAPSPGTITSVSGPRPEQCSHWRTPPALTTALNVAATAGTATARWVGAGAFVRGTADGDGDGDGAGTDRDGLGELVGDVAAVVGGAAVTADAVEQPATSTTASSTGALIAAARRRSPW